MIEWLERLGYGAERKVVVQTLAWPLMTGKHCQCSSKLVPVSNQGKIRQQKERDELNLSYAVLKIQWAINTVNS